MTSYDLLLSSLNLIYNLYYIHEIVNLNTNLSTPTRYFEESQEKQFMSSPIQQENLKMGESLTFRYTSPT